MERPSFWGVVLKTIVVHTFTYSLVGGLALLVVDYPALFAQPDMAALMRPVSDRMVMAGPLFQPIRGLIFGIVIYLLADAIFQRRNGWLVLWAALVGIGILSTFGPSPGSVEGLVFTRITLAHQLRGLPEVLIQSLLLSLGVFYWVTRPTSRRVTVLAAVIFVMVMAMPVLGLLTT